MFAKILVLSLAMAAPFAAMAAHTGTYSNSDGSVTVELNNDGDAYNITLTGQCGKRIFRGAEATSENKITWHGRGCWISVLNTDASSSVMAGGPGCDAYCDGSGTWDLEGATRD